jgi:hypothetical protein
MLVKHINPILLNKLLKSSQEMRTLLTYLKTLLLLCLCNGQLKALASRNAIQIQTNVLYLRIQAMIGNKMDKSNDIVICDTQVLSPW